MKTVVQFETSDLAHAGKMVSNRNNQVFQIVAKIGGAIGDRKYSLVNVSNGVIAFSSATDRELIDYLNESQFVPATDSQILFAIRRVKRFE